MFVCVVVIVCVLVCGYWSVVVVLTEDGDDISVASE